MKIILQKEIKKLKDEWKPYMISFTLPMDQYVDVTPEDLKCPNAVYNDLPRYTPRRFPPPLITDLTDEQRECFKLLLSKQNVYMTGNMRPDSF